MANSTNTYENVLRLTTFKHYRPLILICAVTFTIIILTVARPTLRHLDLPSSFKSQDVPRSVAFKIPSLQGDCLNDSYAEIGNMVQLLKKWAESSRPECRSTYQLMESIYVVKRRTGSLTWDAEFDAKMLRWLGNDKRAKDGAKKQRIIFIRNRFTGEESIFNPLRAKRPGPENSGMSNLEFLTRLSINTSYSCDFCDYKRKTAYDTFGRIESKYCVTAANAFKLDGFHTLIILRNHDPVNWPYEALVDAFGVAISWFHRVHFQNKTYIYPVMTWDLLPKSGGSQVHPHLHVYLKPDGYYGYQQHLFLKSLEYTRKYPQRNIFTDYAHIHNSLGLLVTHGTAVAMVHLTPRKDNEIIVMSERLDRDFIQLLYSVLRTYIDTMKIYSFSMSMTLPTLSGKSNHQPALARVITRAAAQTTKSDVSSMEIFAASNIDTDIFQFTRKLQESTKKILKRLNS